MSLLDSIKKLTAPMLGRVAVPPRWSRYPDRPSSGLDPQRLARIFREADEGNVSRQMQLMEEMEEKDPHLFAQLQTRKIAVTGLDYEIVPFGEEPRDKLIAEFIADQIKGIKNFDAVMLDLLDAIGKGIALTEIMWAYRRGQVVVSDIRPVHQKLLRWDEENQLRLLTAEHPSHGVPLEPNKFIVHQYKGRSGHPARAGILRVCAWMYLFKNYAVKDWVSFAEVYGMPLRVGKYDSAASEDDKAALIRALVQLGSDAAGILPSTADISFIEASRGSSADVYERLARYCDEQMSKAILGQTLTADSGSGSYAQSKTHNEVRHDLTFADCTALAGTLRDDLIRPLVLFNFGETERIPLLQFDAELPEDLQVLVGILRNLNGMNVPIPLSHIYKRFGIPAPQDNEPVTRSQTGAQPDGLPPLWSAHKATSTGGTDPPGSQRRTDQLAAQSVELAADLYGRVFAPIRQLTESADSLEALRDRLEDQQTVNELFEACCSDDLTALLADAMLAADLAGRLRAHHD